MQLYLIIIVSIFLLLEFSNVLALYFRPDFKYANAVGMFKAWNEAQNNEHIRIFVDYLVKWIAGTKLIFIFLMIVILIFGDEKTQLFGVGALIISILSFYWKMYPLIRKMDKNEQIDPKNYSKTLGLMILTFVLALLSTIVVELLC